MRYCLVAVVGTVFWTAHWWRMFRDPDHRGRGWCKAVLPLLMLADVLLFGVFAEDDRNDPSQPLGPERNWLFLVNLAAAFAALLVLMVLDLVLVLTFHAVSRRTRR